MLSAAIASGQIGPNHLASGAAAVGDGAIVSAKVAANVLATPHILNQGILSASIGAVIIGDPHLASGINMAKLAAGGTLPAFTLGGAITGNGKSITGLGIADTSAITLVHGAGIMQTTAGVIYFGGNPDRNGARLGVEGVGYGDSSAYIQTPNASDLNATRLTINGRVDTATASFNNAAVEIKLGLGVGVAAPTVSGRIAVGENVDGVDISAHTHTGGAGDAPIIQSGGIGSGQIGATHLAPGTVAITPSYGRGVSLSGLVLYSLPGVSPNGGNTWAPSNDKDYFYPIYCATAITIDRMALEVTGSGFSGDACRLNIYMASPEWQPTGGPLLPDTPISGLNALGVKAIVVSNQVLSAGRYLMTFNQNTSAPVYRSLTGGGINPLGILLVGATANILAADTWASRTYGAFPNPSSGWTSLLGTGMRYLSFLRICSA